MSSSTSDESSDDAQDAKAKKLFQVVPREWPGWKRAAQRTIKQQSPHKQRKFHSASKLTQREYLLLRVLWPRPGRELTPADRMRLGLAQRYAQADTWLSHFRPFADYLRAVTTNAATETCDTLNAADDQVGLAIFEPTRFEQGQVISVLSIGHAIDEDSVNSSPLRLLLAITAKHPDVACEWLSHRVALNATFNSGAELETRLDRYITFLRLA